MATVRFVRLRSGLYVTKDAQYRIVRRRYLAKQVTLWNVERWNMKWRMYVRLASFHTLAKARKYVSMCQFEEGQRDAK